MLQAILSNSALILSVALGISEALALIPSLKANGILDAVVKLCRALLKK